MIEIQRRIISINARKGFLIPKNIPVHIKFKNNWIENITIASVFTFSEINTKQREIPMSVYNSVQTGPNIQLGGLNLGFFCFEYQLGIDLILNKEPKNPIT